MKKLLALFLFLLLSLTACGEKPVTPPAPAAPGGEKISGSIALVTGGEREEARDKAIWEGIAEFAEANGIDSAAFSPAADSTQARLDATRKAAEAGAGIVVCPGGEFGEVIASAQDEFPDIKFLLLDGDPEADMTVPLAANTHSLHFAEEQCGYLAGYAAVMDGYTQLGFLGGAALPALVRYGYGYLQGADAAAAEKKIQITINYAYAEQLRSSPEITAKMADWFTQGSELLFVCGGDLWRSGAEAALAHGGKIIGADSDRNPLGLAGVADKTFAYNPFLSSAVKGWKAATADALERCFTAWDSVGGVDTTLDLRAGDFVGLATEGEAWNFSSFTREQYARVLAAIADGSVRVSDDSSVEPTLSAHTSVNYIQ